MREPGGTRSGERVRELLKDPAVALGAEAEALLFAAARAELVAQVIRPGARGGQAWWSPTASSTPRSPTRAARAGSGWRRSSAINRFATGGLQPDLTFLLAIEPGARPPRARARATASRTRAPGSSERVLAAYERAGRGRPRALAARSTPTAPPERGARRGAGRGRGARAAGRRA